MKLLVLATDDMSRPRTGSGILARNHVKDICLRHAVTVVSLHDRPEGDGFDGVRWVKVQESIGKTSRVIKQILGVMVGIPVSVSPLLSYNYRRAVSRELMGNFEGIIAYGMGQFLAVPRRMRHLLTINIEDPQSIRINELKKLPIWDRWQRARMTLHQFLTERFESKMFKEAGKVLVLSTVDAARMGVFSVGVCNYGIEVPHKSLLLPRSKRVRGAIVFSGNMGHPPNVDAACYFLSAIFPEVLSKFPGARLNIVGTSPDSRISDLAKHFGESVNITGFVHDIHEYISTAMVSVCPVRLGIGVQTKVLEAMAWGTPVVMTHEANSGVAADRSVAFVGGHPQEFAGFVVKLLRGEEWDQISISGYDFVTRKFSWSNSVDQLLVHVDAVARKCASR